MKRTFRIQTPIGTVRLVLDWRPKGASWYYRFKLRGQPRVYRSAHERDATKAKQIAENTVLAAVGGLGRNKSDLPLCSVIKVFLITRWPDPARDGKDSWKDNRLRLTRWEGWAGSLDLARSGIDEVSRKVQGFLDERKRSGIAAPSILHDHRIIHGFLAWTNRRYRLWPANPADRGLLDLPQVPRRAAPPLDPTWVMAILAWAKDHNDPLYPVLVLCLSGLRPRGACRARWEDLDLGAGTIRTFEKTVERFVPLSAWAVGELQPFATGGAGPIWPLHLDTAFHFMARARQATGAPATCTLQAFRRTAAHRLWARGVPVQLAARIMGHTIGTATRHYVDLDVLGAKEAVENLDFGDKKSQNPSQK